MAGVRKDGILQVSNQGSVVATPVDIVSSITLPVEIISPIGQELSADSIPVVIASDQISIPVTIPEFDVNLSTRASEITLADLNDKLPTEVNLINNIIPNTPRATYIGVLPFVWDNTDYKRIIQSVGDPDGTIQVGFGNNVPVVALSELPTTATANDTTTNPSISKIGSYGFVFNGATWDRMRGTIADGVLVNLGANNNVTVAGVATEATLASSIPILANTESNTANIEVSIDEINAKLGTLGQKNSAGSAPVVLASDQSAIPISGTVSVTEPVTVDASNLDIRDLAFATDKVDVTGSLIGQIKSSTANQTTVADSATSVTILAANANRLGATIVNTSTATLRARLSSSAATLINYTVPIVSGAYYEVPFGYTGAITGIWDTDPGTGSALVSEFVA